MRPPGRIWASRASEERAHRRVVLALGAGVFLTHWLVLPPGWLWGPAPFYVAGALALVAAAAGYRGFHVPEGVVATSAPGVALALRSEYWPFHYGCFPEADGSDRCLLAPPDAASFAVQQLLTSVAFVLVCCGVGYAVGRGLRRLAGGA
ncbi:hypothetical protein [Halosimplex halophilum]|uniref:hypothetical protein n=1 Tax=Halosimplex halophilum TaxID=2559572 RepID=UPI00107F41F8|nr:hypothetical protein [Halosimplex halophilum]